MCSSVDSAVVEWQGSRGGRGGRGAKTTAQVSIPKFVSRLFMPLLIILEFILSQCRYFYGWYNTHLMDFFPGQPELTGTRRINHSGFY